MSLSPSGHPVLHSVTQQSRQTRSVIPILPCSALLLRSSLGDTPPHPPTSRVAQIWESAIVASAGTSHNSFHEIMQALRDLAVSLVGIGGKTLTVNAKPSDLNNFIDHWVQCLSFKVVFQSRRAAVIDSLHVQGVFPVLTKMC